MKVSFVSVGLLLISAAQALPISNTDVAQAKNGTAPVGKSKSKSKRTISVMDGFTFSGHFDDIILGVFWDWGYRLSPKAPKPALSTWDDKENDRFHSNSWSLSQHDVNVLDETAQASGDFA